MDVDPLDGCLEDCRLGPIGFDIGIPSPTLQYGDTLGGMGFDDDCAANEVLVGIRGGTDALWMSQIQGVCSRLELLDAGGLLVAVSEMSLLPLRGTDINNVSAYEASCPAGSAVVGFSGSAGSQIGGLELSCAPIVLVDNGVDLTVSVDTAAAALLPAVGGSGGTAFAHTECAPGEVATAANIRADDDVLAFGISCSTLDLVFP